MKGFFKEEDIRNKEADKPWTSSENDRMIELYLCGSPPDRIASAMERNPKAIKRRLEQFAYNERDLTERYQPVRRTPRKGKRLTETERLLIKGWKERKVTPKAQARFLQRDVRELGLDREDLTALNDMRKVGAGVDLLMAYRYLYYVKGHSIVSDQAYDELEKEEIEFGAYGYKMLKKPGSDRAEDYPPHIRSLALYLVFKYSKKDEQRNDPEEAEAERGKGRV